MRRTFLVLLVLVGACGGGSPPTPQNLDPVNKELDDVTLTLFFDQQDRLTEHTPINFGIAVVAKKPVTLEFSSSQRFEFVVSDKSGKRVWASSEEEAFLMVLGQESIPEGEYREYNESWIPERSGEYRVIGRVTASNRNDLQLSRDMEVE